MPDTQTLIEKVQALSPQRLVEVEDFVDFLTQKDRRQSAIDRLLAIAPALHEAGASPMNDDDVLADIDALRAERRTTR